MNRARFPGGRQAVAAVLVVLGLAGVTLTASARRPVGGTFPIRDEAEAERNPAIAYNSQNNQYLVVWVEESGGHNLIQTRRFSADLTPQPEGTQTLMAGVPGLQMVANPAVAYAFSANKYLVVWDYELNMPPNPTTRHIIGHVVLGNGLPASAGTIDIRLDAGNRPTQHPDLAYNVARNEYLVVWQEMSAGEHNIYGRRLTGHGELLFPELIPITPYSGEQLVPAVGALPNATPQGQYLVVWQEVSSNTQIIGLRISGDGTRDISHNWVLAPGWLRNAAVAGSADARRYLVVATRDEGVTNDLICGQEVSPTGYIGSGFRVGEASCFGGPTAGQAAVGAGPVGSFLVTWQDRPPWASQTDILGQLWGTRSYLPLAIRSQ